MTEPSTRLKQALAQVQPPWDSARTERTQRTLPARRRRAQLRSLLGGLVAIAAIGGTTWQLVEHTPWSRDTAPQVAVVEAPGPTREPALATPTARSPVASEPRQLELADGSRITPLAPSTRVMIEREEEQLIVARLQAGSARFSVTPGLNRTFRVHAQQVLIEVLGTVFELTRKGEQTWVQVEHGRVAVSWGAQRRVLTGGEAGLFPPAVEARTDAGVAVRSLRGHAAQDLPAESWREHAERGDFKSAFPLLPHTDTLAQMGVAELLLAADAARLSGHPRAALPFLERVVAAHPDDPRAPLAAFTLGGVLMNQLGLPREAEAAYGKARSSTHSTALTQDALARQVEAAHRAGDDALARRLAREYLERYPEGRRLQAVRRFGGL